MLRDTSDIFTGREENFRKFRIGYPPEVIELLSDRYGLTDAVVADVGSGVGRLTSMLLPKARTIYAIEPLTSMREMTEREFGSNSAFKSVDATAESTGLPAASIDIIVAAQSFQWFDRDAARREFMRILKPDHYAVILWNDRDIDCDDFHREYEFFVRGLPLYREETHKTVVSDDIVAFFGNDAYDTHTFRHSQVLTLDGLIGRFLSATYSPKPGEEGYEMSIGFFRDLFDRYAKNGVVTIYHTVELFAGRFSR